MSSFKKTYKFALKSSLFITISLSILVGFLLHFFAELDYKIVAIFAVCSFLLSLFIIQFRVEKFIYKRVKRIYDDVSLLESSSFTDEAVTTDMATLTREVEKFASNKKLEIETLKVREEYRKEFLGNVSHELKTPLFTIQGYLLTLIDGAMHDEKILEKYLNRANKGVERLIYIVNDLDMITKLEAGDLNLNVESFDIVEMIQNVFDLFEMKAAKKDISLTFDKPYENPIYVKADIEKIQQVVTNLVVNSIKYGREKGTTEISIEELTEDKYLVRFTDNGIGIDNEHFPRLFERFYRVSKSRSRDEGGSGLGLSIVKHIIEGHNQKIYVESEPGVGSEFSFTIEKSETINS